MPSVWLLIKVIIAISSTTNLCHASYVTYDKNDGGYGELEVVFHKTVKENKKQLEALKSIITDASADLNTAMDGRAYFARVKIVVPETWSKQPDYEDIDPGPHFELADIRIDKVRWHTKRKFSQKLT